MKISIFGAGAIGGHLAAKLAKAGADVSIIARGPHLQAIRANGLTFQDTQQTFTVPVRATDDASTLGPQDLVFTTLKANALTAAVDSIKSLLKPDTNIVYAVNGIPWWYFHKLKGPHAEHQIKRLDPTGRIWNELGPQRALGCVIHSANEVIAPGVIANSTVANEFFIGDPDGTLSPRVKAIGDALSPHVPDIVPTQDIRTAVWKKVAVNVSSSSIGCLSYARSCDIVNDPVLRKLFVASMAEVAEIAKGWDVKVDIDLDSRLERMAAMEHRSSMLQDLQAGRPMEIDAQLASVQDLARLSGTETPLMDVMLGLLMQRARGAGLYASQ